MQIEGSVALVTGANRGIGKALVTSLREARAAKIYAGARDVAKLDSTVMSSAYADIEADLRTNVFDTLSMIEAFRPVLESAREAAVVNVHSLAALPGPVDTDRTKGLDGMAEKLGAPWSKPPKECERALASLGGQS